MKKIRRKKYINDENDDEKGGGWTTLTIAACNNQSVKSLESRNAVLCLQRPLKEPLNGGRINRFALTLYRGTDTASNTVTFERINLQNINSWMTSPVVDASRNRYQHRHASGTDVVPDTNYAVSIKHCCVLTIIEYP